MRKVSLGGNGRKMGKRELRTVKVSEETYMRLKWFKNMMELHSLEEGKAVSYSMDAVISTMMDLLQSAKIRFLSPKKEKDATQVSR